MKGMASYFASLLRQGYVRPRGVGGQGGIALSAIVPRSRGTTAEGSSSPPEADLNPIY